nr:META domain-containing protein [Allomuricauda sp.]
MIRNVVRPLVALMISLFFVGCSDDDPVQNQTLLGQWELVAISASDSPIGPVLEPAEGETISITFQGNGEFSGSTSINAFGGTNSTDNDTLFINEMISTQALDTEFGQAFYQAINDSSNGAGEPSIFEMTFVGEDILNLEYNGFKFLSLERI